MSRNSCKQRFNNAIKLLGTLALIFSMASFAQANETWFSGPSIVTVGNTAMYSGGNLEPSTLVRVETHEEGTSAYETYVLVNEDGTLTHEIDPSLDGQLTLSVFDNNNNELATVNVIVTE